MRGAVISVAVVSSLGAWACGGTPAPLATPPQSAVGNVAADDTADDATATCVRAALAQPPMSPYVVPSGSSTFRAEVSERSLDLYCCLPEDAFEGADNGSIRLQVVLQSGASGGGRLTAAPPFDDDVVACLGAVLATWRLPAIGSDSITPGVPSRPGRLNIPIVLTTPPD